jgi:hypothetical protein
MTLDTSVRRLAQRVMRKVGTEAIIRRVTVGTYDTATGTGTDTETDVEVVGRRDPVTSRQLSDTVLTSDEWFTFAAADIDFEPQPSDKVVIGDDVFTVVNPNGVRREMAQHLPALYVLQLRR